MRYAVLEREQLHAAPVRVEVRPHLLERGGDALLERHGVQVVDEQRLADHRVGGEALSRVGIERSPDPPERLAVQVQHLTEQLLLDGCHQQSPVGVCITFFTFPPP